MAEPMDGSKGNELEALFQRADKVGKKRYHRLTAQDLADYKKFEAWRYVQGNSTYGTTEESRRWARENSDYSCPVCGMAFRDCGGRTIDHKLPRSQYPWLSLNFRNLWVICQGCNREKGERHWYEYEHYMMLHHPRRYEDVRFARPRQLLRELRE